MGPLEIRTITSTDAADEELSSRRRLPGVVAVFSAGAPVFQVARLDRGPVEIGRAGGPATMGLHDDHVSRAHSRVDLTEAGVRITDLGSRNGTFVDGRRVQAEELVEQPRVLRAGQSLLLFAPDVYHMLGASVAAEGASIVGPTLQLAHNLIARAAAGGTPVLMTGESGAGKELAARLFHEKTGRNGPFVAVNCAAIPTGLAERLLFGARRGVYSGAVDNAEGYLQSAAGGTLFLDELAELDPAVQAKLLRVIETGEVVPLGASHPIKVDVRFCAATLKSLRAEVAEGRFRRDLYYRVARPEVELPSLLGRLEDLPWLAHGAMREVDRRLTATALFIESCLLRAWPGNVRELLFAAGEAARAALADDRVVVQARDLPAAAGQPLSTTPPSRSLPSSKIEVEDSARAAVRAALIAQQGNVTRAARVLGWHRNQLRRWLAREEIDPLSFRGRVPT